MLLMNVIPLSSFFAEKVNSFYVTFIKQLLEELMLHNPDRYSIILYLWITHPKKSSFNSCNFSF